MLLLEKEGPEGFGRKNFTNETQCVTDKNEIEVQVFYTRNHHSIYIAGLKGLADFDLDFGSYFVGSSSE